MSRLAFTPTGSAALEKTDATVTRAMIQSGDVIFMRWLIQKKFVARTDNLSGRAEPDVFAACTRRAAHAQIVMFCEHVIRYTFTA